MRHQPTILFPWASRVYYHTPMFSLWELVAMVKYTQILRFAGISRSMWYRWKLRHQQPFERRPAVGWGRCMRAWNYYCRKLLLRFWWWTQSKTFQEHDVSTQHPRHRAGWLPDHDSLCISCTGKDICRASQKLPKIPVFDQRPSIHCLRLLRPEYLVVSTCCPCFSYWSETKFSDFFRLLLRVGRLTFPMRPCKCWVGRLRTKTV